LIAGVANLPSYTPSNNKRRSMNDHKQNRSRAFAKIFLLPIIIMLIPLLCVLMPGGWKEIKRGTSVGGVDRA